MALDRNDIIYLVTFVVYILICFCRCHWRNRQRNEDMYNDAEPYMLPVGMTEAEREQFVRRNIIIKKAEDMKDFSIHELYDEENEEAGGKQSEPVANTNVTMEIDEKDSEHQKRRESLFNSLANSLRSGINSIERMPPSLSKKQTQDHEEEKNPCCSICFEDYEIGDELCESTNNDCPHKFHADCMISWLVKHKECPICRHDYLNTHGNDFRMDLESGTSPHSMMSVPGSFAVVARMNAEPMNL